MTILYTALWIILDLLTKYLFYDLSIWNNIFWPIKNHGISYSMLSGQTIYIISITIIILAIIVYIYYKGQISKISYILIMAWGVGNLIDRVIYGYVRDFVYVWNWFPVFNVADILIFCGCMLIFYQIRNANLQETKTQP